jgi:hypothetical protein
MTRAHGGQTPGTVGTLASPGNDGEDRFIVYYLQDMATVTSPDGEYINPVTGQPVEVTVNGAGVPTLDPRHTLTLDGQADTDYYDIYTLGSNGVDERNYIINILDTGQPNDGVDEATIHGFDSNQNGVDGASGNKLPTDDIFLLRAVTSLPGEAADHPGFVAMLHGNLNPYLDIVALNEDSHEVQRINYDRGLNGRLTVLGYGGNDYFASDDTTTTVTLDGGKGYDTFQIGQIFGNKRNVLEGALLAQDVFPEMVATTRGWLSPGSSAPMMVHGGTGNDEFTVYSNQAETAPGR